jgi:hypothetical protein
MGMNGARIETPQQDPEGREAEALEPWSGSFTT